MRKVILTLVVALMISLFILPVTAQEMMMNPSVHTECQVDLSGEKITLYHFGDISGAYAAITQPIIAAFDDAVKYWNANGGICGAEVAHFNEDTGGSPENTQASYDRFKAFSDLKLLVLYSSPDSELLRDQLAEDEIPVIISAGSVEGLYGENGDEPGWIFAGNPLYVDQLGSFCDYVSANGAMYPDPVIGYISWPGAFGEAAFTAETIAYCGSKGVTILDTPEFFAPTETDITTKVQNLVDAGANILYTNSLATGPALIAGTVATLGLEDEVRLAGVNWVMDITVGLLGQRVAKANGMPAVDGMVGSMPFHWWSERSVPGVQFITQQADANARSLLVRNIAYLLSWGSFDLFAEIMIQTANRVGSYEGITGQDIKETLEGLVYEPLGLYTWDMSGGELRAPTGNRIAMLAFLNATGTGPATSRDDAMKVATDTGEILVPIVIPLTDFLDAPDLRPGGADVP